MAMQGRTERAAVALGCAAGLMISGAAAAQAVYDPATRVLSVPTVQVDGQAYRDARIRLDADGRLTLLALQPPLDVATRAQAAAATAQSRSNACAPVQPFYWEIGDRTQRLAGGSVDSASRGPIYDATTVMNIASASKWLYGAYVAERRGGAITAEDVLFLNFRSGYTNFAPSGCDRGDTVAACSARGTSGVPTPANVGLFFYDGAHMQKHASLPAPGMALGTLDNAGLADEMRRVLGTDIAISYTSPQLAGGARMAAKDYSVFLRRVLGGQLKISGLLGAYPVCTNPATCVTAVASPGANLVDWQYSLGHWVEAGAGGDGSTSSPGAFGFYPWIDAARSHYGVLARADGVGQGYESAACGALIRKAWASGVAQ
ncbi:MAG: hypothetical protein JNN18_10615 [Rubrivivax sp.]|nr:hypothetical protein [Rubrivivax sp.]